LKLSRGQIKQAAEDQIASAEGYESGELSQIRKLALDYYFLRPEAAPSADGRSALQSSDVADMVEAVTAQIMPAFTMDSIVEFDAVSEDDVEQSSMETAAVSYVIMDQNNGFYQIQTCVKDALLMRNGFAKVGLKKRVTVKTERYEGLSPDEYGDLVARAVDDVGNVDNGHQVISSEIDGRTYNAAIKTKSTMRQVDVRSVDPLNMSWAADWDSIYLDDCPFFCEYEQTTRSDLIDEGYPASVVASLNKSGFTSDTNARNNNTAARANTNTDPSMDWIDRYTCYQRLDVDGDGVAELCEIVIAGDELLDYQEVEFIPYASGTPFLMPHRFNGLGLFDKIQTIQDGKTAVLRQMIDNQNNANNSE